MKRIVVLLLLLLPLTTAELAFAQSNRDKLGSIKGQVLDEKTGEWLIGANVYIVNTCQGASTDIDGNYTILNVQPGTYALKATYIGYKSLLRDTITVLPGVATVLNFELKDETYKTEEIVVVAEKAIIDRQATNTKVVISNQDLQVSGMDVQVSVSAPPPTSINIRGSRSDQTGFTVNLQPSNKTTHSSLSPCAQYDSEAYGKYIESAYIDALKVPMSTFSIDVDAASYTNIRRMINYGSRPPSDAVRIEEMVNYFSYSYPQPADRHPFSIVTEIAECPWNADHKLALVALQGKIHDPSTLPPANLVFLIDVSGSMNEPNKLPLVQAAFRLLTKRLRPEDKVAIVTYAGYTRVELEPVSGSQRETILASIDRLTSSGSTAGAAGLTLAYEQAEKMYSKEANNRVILATDGDFNVGVSSTDELVRIMEEKRKKGIYLTILGFGYGNLKDEKLEQIADKGNGSFAYVDSYKEASRIFGGQLAGTLFTIAKDVKLQVEFNPAAVASYRLIGYDNRLLKEEDFRNDTIDAGEMGAGHSVTAFYEIVPAGTGEKDATEGYKYSERKLKNAAAETNEYFTVHVRYKDPTTNAVTETESVLRDGGAAPSETFRFASAVAEFGLLLKSSAYKGNASFSSAIERAKSALGIDEDGARRECALLMEAAGNLDETR